MNSEISRLGLPRGEWQKAIIEAIPEVKYVGCYYPDEQTVTIKAYDNPKAEWQDRVFQFSLSFMFGCRGVLISHSMQVYPPHGGKGIATRLQKVKERIAQDLKVSLLMATVRDDNAAEKHVISEWKLVDVFSNFRTGNVINVYTKEIKR